MKPRRVLVTGASGSIGSAVARQLAAAGFGLGLHYHRGRVAAETLLSGLPPGVRGNCSVLGFDCADRDAAKGVLAADVAEHGAYWGVVVNAGVTADAVFPALAAEQWDRVLRVDLDGFYNVLAPLVMPMIHLRDGGRIVVMSSTAGQIGNRGQVNYSAAKAGLIGAAKALALELASRGITVNCIAPGLIDTPMTQAGAVAEVIPLIPMRRVGTPDDVAALVAFLCGDAAAYITRQVIGVNGGLS